MRRTKNLIVLVLGSLLVLSWLPAASAATPQGGTPSSVVNLTDRQLPLGVVKQISRDGRIDVPGARSNGRNWGTDLTVVQLRGKTNHFGRDVTSGAYIDYWATVPDVRVWIAEHPFTRDLDIRTDETGWWTMYVVKERGVDLELSFVYEKDGWVTTKSNAIPVADDDITDLAIQYIDPDYYHQQMKPYVQAVWLGATPFENAMVVTVGKSWSSMHDGRLPHGDPGALAFASPAAGVGPIYFNRQVIPDPTETATSVDGGVTWLNMPLDQTYEVTAQKDGVSYDTVRFHVETADLAYGVELYIASPPHSVEGDNDSAPGQP
jgi:hypothetical protein